MQAVLYNDVEHPNSRKGEILPKRLATLGLIMARRAND
jgi:hypothetical protein